MKSTTKHSVSDWTVITLRSIGILLGLVRLVNPSSQLDMPGLQASDGTFGKVIRGLLTSSQYPRFYIDILYIFGEKQALCSLDRSKNTGELKAGVLPLQSTYWQ